MRNIFITLVGVGIILKCFTTLWIPLSRNILYKSLWRPATGPYKSYMIPSGPLTPWYARAWIFFLPLYTDLWMSMCLRVSVELGRQISRKVPSRKTVIAWLKDGSLQYPLEMLNCRSEGVRGVGWWNRWFHWIFWTGENIPYQTFPPRIAICTKRPFGTTDRLLSTNRWGILRACIKRGISSLCKRISWKHSWWVKNSTSGSVLATGSGGLLSHLLMEKHFIMNNKAIIWSLLRIRHLNSS